jgi:hypothetical protein
MTIPASDQYTGMVEESIATSKEMAEKLTDDISESKDTSINIDLIEAQSLASQLRLTACLIEGLLIEHNTIMVRVNELIDMAQNKKRGKKE